MICLSMIFGKFLKTAIYVFWKIILYPPISCEFLSLRNFASKVKSLQSFNYFRKHYFCQGIFSFHQAYLKTLCFIHSSILIQQYLNYWMKYCDSLYLLYLKYTDLKMNFFADISIYIYITWLGCERIALGIEQQQSRPD